MNEPVKHMLLVIVSVLVLLSGHSIAQVLSLDQTIQMASENNDKIKQYREKLEQAESEDREALGNFLPSVTLQANYYHMNDPLSIDLSPIREAMIQMQANDQVELSNIYELLQEQPALTSEQRAELYNQYSSGLDDLLPAFGLTFRDQDYRMASLVATQPLFMGGKLLAAKNISAAEKRAAEAELVSVENRIIREAVENYLSIVLLHQAIKTREDVLAGMQQHRQNAQRLYDEGLIARYDLLRAEVAVAEADRNLFDERNNLELAMVAFRNTLGLDDDATVVICDTLAFHSVSDSLGGFLEQAYSHQPILHVISEKRNAASQKYTVEQSRFLPQLVGFGKYELYDKDLSALEPRWIVGVQLSMNIFNGFKDHHRLSAAKSLKREVDFLDVETKRQINLWVNKSYRDMRNAETRFQKLEATVALAEESVRLNDKRFQTGLGTTLEVIDAQLSLEKNLIDRLTSLYEYYKSLTDLLVATGNPSNIVTIWNGEEN